MSDSKGTANRIVVNPSLMGGLPHVRGTDVLVSTIISKVMIDGWDPERLMGRFPELTHEDIQATLDFARGMFSNHGGIG